MDRGDDRRRAQARERLHRHVRVYRAAVSARTRRLHEVKVGAAEGPVRDQLSDAVPPAGTGAPRRPGARQRRARSLSRWQRPAPAGAVAELAPFRIPGVAYFARLGLAFPPDVLKATAARTSALNASASTSSPSWMSIARRVFPSRLELKSLAGSSNEAPLANVSFTTDLYDSPVQMIPPCDQVGVPGFVGLTHFHSSTTSGSASWMSLRILLKVSPRQSSRSAILWSISSDADWPSVESDFSIFSP